MPDGPSRLPGLDDVTVLLVDDALEERDLTASILALGGATVLEVATSGEAKAGIPHVRPDVVITEMALPDGTGADLVRWIRGHESDGLRSTVVIAMTRWSAEFSCEAARAAGFQGYFVKPGTTDDLVVGVAALVRASRHPRSRV